MNVTNAVIIGGGLLLFYGIRKLLYNSADSTCPNNERLVVVTGCDSGFGSRLVSELCKKGFIVVAACFSKERAEDITNTYDGAWGVSGDLTKSLEPVLKTVHELLDENASLRLWAVVNNAGIAVPGNVEWLSPDIYERTMAINYHVPVKLVYELLPLLKKSVNSRVVNVTSVDGFISLPSNAAYCGSKHALEAYSDVLRCEMLPWKVRVAVIEPSSMRTPMVANFWDTWKKTFDDAPSARSDSVYGEEWVSKIHKAGAEGIEAIAMDPMKTIKEMMHAVTAKDPQPRYKCGILAKTLFTFLAHLPDGIRDKVLYNITFGKGGTPIKLKSKN